MSDASRSPLLDACSGRTPCRIPVWFMRQAGRVLPAYRRLRAEFPSVASLFDSAELAARITVMPVEQLGVDAAILFTDLITPLRAIDVTFEYAPGPVLKAPPRTEADIFRLPDARIRPALNHVLEAAVQARSSLEEEIALIGYAASPFTLAAWLLQGGGSGDWSRLRSMLYSAPHAARFLLSRLTVLIGDFVQAQVEAGAQVIQIFDTSVGVLSPELYREFGVPYLQSVFSRLSKLHVPGIYFPLAGAHLLPWFSDCGATVLSLDWRTSLSGAWKAFGCSFPLQGNLDPCTLFASGDALDRATLSILAAARGKPHIFNLGHGLLPETPLESVRHVVDIVHAFRPVTYGSAGHRQDTSASTRCSDE